MCSVCGDSSSGNLVGVRRQSRSAGGITPKKWRNRISGFHYFIIFISGSFCSGLMFALLNYVPSYRILPQRVAPHYLPDGNFLQIADEVKVLEPYLSAIRIPASFDDSVKRNKNEHDTNEQEALSSLKVAIEMKQVGKDDKALRLFQHALALSPKHPEVLTKYGEFLEHNQQDVVRADHFYYQALTVNPSHSEALANRQRTAQIVEHLDQKRFEGLDKKRNALSSVHASNAALKRAEKEAYIQHIYHSVGIEGNTMSLAQTRSILETKMAVDGKSIDEHNEILGLDAAMKYINATLVNKNDFITLKDILEIHRRVLGHVDPVEGGEFRRTQVYVGGHVPPGPGDLSILMARFESWLNSEQSFVMHPVKYAAMAHYKLVHIHPFSDGNGRTSRLLMNTLLMRAGYPPVIIQKQHRHKYYDYLQIANGGDIRPFVRFIADCTERTLDLYLWATSELSNPIPLLAQELNGVPLINNFEQESVLEGSGTGGTIRIDVI
ncbi:protein adenylyltransferase Fic [Toxorhynchites rutilus septentrionalis]|uniref:protein adenylyltransferase Fic n=1 Tax=Toxorhynchites rutilus septentrionalis TaxID=329112 RepID=UPI00247A628B|nr:protein adenylyltransferase Fic [Toxorhynchites rutilus septentrionalis]